MDTVTNGYFRKYSDEELDELLPRDKAFSIIDNVYNNSQIQVEQPTQINEEPVPKRSVGGTLWSSTLRGTDNTQGLLYGAVGLAGSAIGNDTIRDFGYEGYLRNVQEADENKAEIGSYKNIRTDGNFLGDLGTYAVETIVELAPTLAATITSGGLGGMLAGTTLGSAGINSVARTALTKLAEKEIGKRIAAGMTKEAAEKAFAQTAGKLVGAWAGSTAMESGGMFTEDADVRGVENANPYSALGLGAISGATDVVFGAEGSLLRNLAGAGGKKVAKQLEAHLGKEMLKGLASEGLQESFQELLAITNVELNNPGHVDADMLQERMIESGLKGAIGGVPMSGYNHLGNRAAIADEKQRLYQQAETDRAKLRGIDAQLSGTNEQAGATTTGDQDSVNKLTEQQPPAASTPPSGPVPPTGQQQQPSAAEAVTGNKLGINGPGGMTDLTSQQQPAPTQNIGFTPTTEIASVPIDDKMRSDIQDRLFVMESRLRNVGSDATPEVRAALEQEVTTLTHAANGLQRVPNGEPLARAIDLGNPEANLGYEYPQTERDMRAHGVSPVPNELNALAGQNNAAFREIEARQAQREAAQREQSTQASQRQPLPHTPSAPLPADNAMATEWEQRQAQQQADAFNAEWERRSQNRPQTQVPGRTPLEQQLNDKITRKRNGLSIDSTLTADEINAALEAAHQTGVTQDMKPKEILTLYEQEKNDNPEFNMNDWLSALNAVSGHETVNKLTDMAERVRAEKRDATVEQAVNQEREFNKLQQQARSNFSPETWRRYREMKAAREAQSLPIDETNSELARNSAETMEKLRRFYGRGKTSGGTNGQGVRGETNGGSEAASTQAENTISQTLPGNNIEQQNGQGDSQNNNGDNISDTAEGRLGGRSEWDGLDGKGAPINPRTGRAVSYKDLETTAKRRGDVPALSNEQADDMAETRRGQILSEAVDAGIITEEQGWQLSELEASNTDRNVNDIGGELKHRKSAAAAAKAEAARSSIISIIKRLGGITPESLNERFGKDASTDIAKRFGPGIVRKKGSSLDMLEAEVQEAMTGYPETYAETSRPIENFLWNGNSAATISNKIDDSINELATKLAELQAQQADEEAYRNGTAKMFDTREEADAYAGRKRADLNARNVQSKVQPKQDTVSVRGSGGRVVQTRNNTAIDDDDATPMSDPLSNYGDATDGFSGDNDTDAVSRDEGGYINEDGDWVDTRKGKGNDTQYSTKGVDEAVNGITAKLTRKQLLPRIKEVFGKEAVYESLPSGNVIVTLSNGSTILVRQEDKMVHHADPSVEVNGSWKNREQVLRDYGVALDSGGIMSLSKTREATTVTHEQLHAAMSLALTEGERKLLLKHYRSIDPKNRDLSDMEVEELVAYDYQKWNPAEPKSMFGKIYKLAKGLKRALFGESKPSSPDDVFRKIRDNKSSLNLDSRRDVKGGTRQGKMDSLRERISKQKATKDGEAVADDKEADATVEQNDTAYQVSNSVSLAEQLAEQYPEYKELFAKIGGRYSSASSLTKRLNTFAEAIVRDAKGDESAIKDVFFGKLRASVFDVFDRIRVLGDKADVKLGYEKGAEAYMSTRLATSIDSIMAAFLTHGGISWNEGVSKLTTRDEGLLTIAHNMGDDLRPWLWNRIARRAKRLMELGLERNLTKDDIAILEQVTNERRAQNSDQWDAADKQYEALQKQVLYFAVQSGTMSKADVGLWNNADYIPFYRIMEDAFGEESTLVGLPGGSKIKSGIKKLEGKDMALDDPVINIVKNWTIIMSQAMRNNARTKVIDVAQDLGGVVERVPSAFKGREDVVNIMREGRHEYYRVLDLELYKALTIAPSRAPENIGMKIGQKAKKLLTYGATFSPDFRLANFLRDTIQAMALYKDYGFMDAIGGFKKAWNEDADYIQLKAAGGAFSSGFLHGSDPESVVKYVEEVVVDDNGKSIIKRTGIKKLLDTWAKIGDAAENANRVAVYSKLKEDRGELQAAYEAKDLLDFSMRGSSKTLQAFTTLIPFLNARIAGLYKVRRSVAGKNISEMFTSKNERREELIRMAKLLTTTSVALVAYNMATNKDKWDELKDHEKRGYYHLFIGDSHFRMPKPFELGAIFSSLPEAVFDTLDKGDARILGSFLSHTFMDTFAMNPIFQAVKPVAEIWANRDSFTGEDIIPLGMEYLTPEMQFKEHTPEVYKAFGKAFGVSPVRVEHLVSGYTAALGTMFATTADIAMETFGLADDKPINPNNIWLYGKIVRDDELVSVKQVTQFYDFAKKVDEVAYTIKAMQREGDKEALRDYVEENAAYIKNKRVASSVREAFRKIRLKRMAIARSSDMSTDEKDRQLRILIKKRNDIATQVIDALRKQGLD